MYKNKKDVLYEYPELELTEFGDFKVKCEYTQGYHIVDFHCHLYKGMEELFPKLLKGVKNDMSVSFFDNSCFPFSLKLFDLNQVYYTKFPNSLACIDGVKTRLKLQLGGLIIKKATAQRLIRDMAMNNISKSVIMQINPPDKNSSGEMHKITNNYKELITFGSIHPRDKDIHGKIDHYLSLDIKGWKINPHVGEFAIDSTECKNLLRLLSKTGLPILSCSGLGIPDEVLNTALICKKQRLEQTTQRIKSFYSVMDIVSKSIFVFAHAGVFDIYELIELMKKYPNTYTDISTQPPQNIKKLLESLGSERLLFGTDYPFFNQALTIVSVLRATDNVEDRKNIFSRNALRILDI